MKGGGSEAVHGESGASVDVNPRILLDRIFNEEEWQSINNYESTPGCHSLAHTHTLRGANPSTLINWGFERGSTEFCTYDLHPADRFQCLLELLNLQIGCTQLSPQFLKVKRIGPRSSHTLSHALTYNLSRSRDLTE